MKAFLSNLFALSALFVLFVPTQADASETAVTVAYRGMAGVSFRLEHPVADRVVLLEDIGASGWIVYGDDPSQGASPLLLRLHGKLGTDVALQESEHHWYAGGRVVGAYILNTVGDQAEVAVQGTVGRKWNPGNWRLQIGGGLGAHYLWTLDDPSNTLLVPMPHVEARLGLRF